MEAIMDGYHFFMNPHNTPEFFYVINEEMRQDMLERGFIEIHVEHLTDMASLQRYFATTDDGANSAQDEQPVGGVPEGANYPDETTAVAIVRAVEDREATLSDPVKKKKPKTSA
jgi:hypothetical protein